MNAQDLTKALGGRWHGSSGVVRCPAHDDHEPSLSVRDGDDGRLLTHCFSGCSAEAVWGALVDRGLVDEENNCRTVRHFSRRRRQHPDKAARAPSPNQALALEIWRAALPALGTPAETYLRGRGITIPTPASVRYHPALLHPDIGQHLPAMVAAVCNVERQVTGIQRIFLTMHGRKAPLTRPKMALGTLRGGAVRLAPMLSSVSGRSAIYVGGIPS